MIYTSQNDCKSDLGKKMQQYRTDRPDEWTMDVFISDAEKMHIKINEIKKHAFACCDYEMQAELEDRLENL